MLGQVWSRQFWFLIQVWLRYMRLGEVGSCKARLGQVMLV
jgi:hypothetical protein